MNTYTIMIHSNPGIYGVDDKGNHWTTFWLPGNSTAKCDECGAALSEGYKCGGYPYDKNGNRGEWMESMYFCLSHMQIYLQAEIQRDILTALASRIQTKKSEVQV